VQAAVWRWAPVVAWAALIFGLSSISDLGTGLGTWDLVLRKIAHAAEFAVLGFLLQRAVQHEAAALALGLAYAVSDELHQHFVPGRQGSALDVLIDTAGVALGIYVMRRVGRIPDYHSTREGAEGRRRQAARRAPRAARPPDGRAQDAEPPARKR
jgi:VanZ family protein